MELADGLQRMRFEDANFRQSKFIRLNVLSDLRDRGLLDDDLVWKPAAVAAGYRA
jgi:hypothetical protein